MKVKGESFTETLKTLRRGKRRKTEEDRSLQKKRKGKKTEGQKEKPREENKERGMKAKSERHKKIASKGASLGKLRDVLSASWDELNYLS
jgi:hypothetical protein